MEPSCGSTYKLVIEIELDWTGAVLGTEEGIKKEVLKELNLPTDRVCFPGAMAAFTIKDIKEIKCQR